MGKQSSKSSSVCFAGKSLVITRSGKLTTCCSQDWLNSTVRLPANRIPLIPLLPSSIPSHPLPIILPLNVPFALRQPPPQCLSLQPVPIYSACHVYQPTFYPRYSLHSLLVSKFQLNWFLVRSASKSFRD